MGVLRNGPAQNRSGRISVDDEIGAERDGDGEAKTGSIMAGLSNSGQAARVERQQRQRAEADGKEQNVGHGISRSFRASENAPGEDQISIGKFGPMHKEKIRDWPFASERAGHLGVG